jgi:hypothetical protein
MRYRLMATYRGVPYEAGIGPADGNVVLFAACPPPEELGFEPATGHWRKELARHEVQALWESRPTGKFQGAPCMVLDDLGDRLHITYLGHDSYRAEQLGYWQVDRGVFEMITPREEVTEIVEERVDFAGRTAPSPPTASPPGVPRAPRELGEPRDQGLPRDLGEPRDQGLPRDLGTSRALASDRPLPLEEAARLAASARLEASARLTASAPGLAQEEPDWPSGPASLSEPTSLSDSHLLSEPTSLSDSHLLSEPESLPESDSGRSRRHDSALRRLATQRIFTELAGLAAIPPSAFAVGEEVDGAMCLIQSADGFEVFNAADGARHEVRLFEDEESAYFYLFGILAAEAVRTGRLTPQQ